MTLNLTLRSTLKAVAMVAGTLLLSASAFQGSCGKCYTSYDGGAHVFGDVHFTGQLMDCDAANSCHSNSQPGACSLYHLGCQDMAMRTVDAVEGALASGDAAAVGRLIAASDGRVKFIDARDALQVTGCAGEVVAHFPVAQRIAAILD